MAEEDATPKRRGAPKKANARGKARLDVAMSAVDREACEKVSAAKGKPASTWAYEILMKDRDVAKERARLLRKSHSDQD